MQGSLHEQEPGCACEKIVIAIPREPLDFLRRAVEAGHPSSNAISLPDDLKRVVEWNRDADAYTIHKHRIDFVKFWTERARKLGTENQQLMAEVPPHLRPILQGKRLALWHAMVDHFDYPDKRLVSDITNGFPVTGWLPDSQIFPRESRPPSMDVATLEALSRGMNAHVKAKVLSAASNELAEVTWEETEKELAEGWMELDQGQGERAAWAMRFGLKQKEKVRVIDDFSIAGVNQTAGMREKLKIFGIDDIAALIAHSLDSVGAQVHPKLLGKTIDLKSAYKQFGVCSEDRERIRVATSRPTSSELVLLLVNSLPFGATGSVAAFLRISMFLWYIGVAGLRLAWISFYDDYTLLSRPDCAENTAWCAECLFDMLGVLFAREGKKATSFDHTFNALGVVFDLKSIAERVVFIGHTESRRMELAETLRDLLKEKNYSAKAIERLRGRLLWFENFVCGRQANFLVARLGKFSAESKFNKPMDDLLRETLVMLLARVEAGRPTEVSTRVFSTWVLFTDGACEEASSVGGVLINPLGCAVAMFGDVLPKQFEKMFYRESAHPIYEVELLPILIAFTLWSAIIDKCQLVSYLDNDAARAGLIRGAGATRLSDVIIQMVCEHEAQMQLKTWFSRVPSHSNISDGPSRLEFGLLEKLGCSRHAVPWSKVESLVMPRLT